MNPHVCDNDGGQFTLNPDGQYVNTRRSEGNLSYVSADAVSTTGNVSNGFRTFMGSDGVERLWLSRDTNGTLVGQQVWDGVDAKVMIVSEIFS